jgi:hypothetical protein
VEEGCSHVLTWSFEALRERERERERETERQRDREVPHSTPHDRTKFLSSFKYLAIFAVIGIEDVSEH